MQSLEICRLYELGYVSAKLMKVFICWKYIPHLCFLISKLVEKNRKTYFIWSKLYWLDLWSASLETWEERVWDFLASASTGRALSQSDFSTAVWFCWKVIVRWKSQGICILQAILETLFILYLSFLFLFHTLNMQQWEGLVELLGSDSQISGGLDFLHK